MVCLSKERQQTDCDEEVTDVNLFLIHCDQPPDPRAPVEDTQPNIVMVLAEDLANDSYELRNVIVDPLFADVLSGMAVQLNRLLEEIS